MKRIAFILIIITTACFGQSENPVVDSISALSSRTLEHADSIDDISARSQANEDSITSFSTGKQSNLEIVNVKDYGAEGDGTTDDITAINNALTSSDSGDIVFLPPGTFLVSATVRIPGGVIFDGVGTIKATTSMNDTIIVLNDYSQIRNITIDGNRVNQSAVMIGIGAYQKYNMTIKKVIVKHIYGGAGIAIDKGGGFIIDGALVFDIYGGNGSTYLEEPHGIMIRSNNWDGDEQYKPSRKIINCEVYNIGMIGIDVRQSAWDVEVSNCDVYNIGITGQISIGIQSYNRSNRTIITNNRVWDIPGGTGTSGWAVSVDQSEGAVISDNIITVTVGTSYCGIELVASIFSSVSNNTITRDTITGASDTYYGIILDKSSYNTLSSNKIYDKSDGDGIGIKIIGAGTNGYDPYDFYNDSKTSTTGCYYNTINNTVIYGHAYGVYIDQYCFGSNINGGTIQAKKQPVYVISGNGTIQNVHTIALYTDGATGYGSIFLSYVSASYPTKNWKLLNNTIEYSGLGIGMQGAIDNINIAENMFVRERNAVGSLQVINSDNNQTNVSFKSNNLSADSLNLYALYNSVTGWRIEGNTDKNDFSSDKGFISDYVPLSYSNDTLTVDWSTGQNFYISLTQDTYIDFSNLVDGKSITVSIYNPSTHSLIWKPIGEDAAGLDSANVYLGNPGSTEETYFGFVYNTNSGKTKKIKGAYVAN